MLHYATIYPDTLGLLKELMQKPELSNFSLAGGTSLALQIGHRISYDLDMFGNEPLDVDEVLDLLSPIVKVEILQQSKNILILDASGIKLDFVNYRYPLLYPPTTVDGIRLLTKADIAAMKLAAIAGRGKKRDFVDLYFLLQEYDMRAIMDFYKKKYPDGSEMMVVRSLSYFDDADKDEDVVFLKHIEWTYIKSELLDRVKSSYL